MNDEINYKNNPLNGVSLKQMLTELSGHYGFDILFAYLNINCFKNNPSVASSIKFLKKTDWAREKVEGFYLYTYKSLPKASNQQSKLPPRDRIVPDDQSAGEPAVLSLEEAEQLREERILKAAEFDRKGSADIKERRKVTGTNNNGHSDSPDENDSSKSEPETGGSIKRTASTADNPWGILKE